VMTTASLLRAKKFLITPKAQLLSHWLPDNGTV